VAPIILIVFLGLFFRALKSRFLLLHIKRVKISSLFKTVLTGFMVNSILPARAGEFYRAYFLNKLEDIPPSSIFATVVFERIYDGIILGLCILYVLLSGVISNKSFFTIGLISSGVYLLAVIVIVFYYFKRDLVIKMIKKVLFFFPSRFMKKVNKFLISFYNGLHVIKSIKNLLLFTLFTFITWFFIFITNYLFLESMNIFPIVNMGISKLDLTIFMMIGSIIGVSIPLAPGAFGSFQGGIVLALCLLNPELRNVDSPEYSLIVSFSMYVWGVQWLCFIISGFIVWAREHIKLIIKK
jgi:uncharacterized protein (TIRG00374 family)